MTEFVGQDTGENDPDQGKTSTIAGRPMGGVVGVPHKKREQEKGPVDAKFDAEDSAYRNGPASHGKPVGFSAPTILYSLDNRLEPGVAISSNPR